MGKKQKKKEYQELLEADYDDSYTAAPAPKDNSTLYGILMLIGIVVLAIANFKLFVGVVVVLIGVVSCFAIFSGVGNVVEGTINRNTRYNEENDD